jgi:hypothetical protein
LAAEAILGALVPEDALLPHAHEHLGAAPFS